MRKWVEYAVENYKGKNSFGFQLAKDLKEKQIDRAIERYARGVQHKEVAAVLDTSAFKSGKTGFLLTDRYLYSDKCKEEGPVGLMYLKSVFVKPENNSCCVLGFEDGSTREIDISVFLDVADVLKLIIEQKEKYEAEEKEREQGEEDSAPEAADAKEKAARAHRGAGGPASSEAEDSKHVAVSGGSRSRRAEKVSLEGLGVRVEFGSADNLSDAESTGASKRTEIEIGERVSEKSGIKSGGRIAGKSELEAAERVSGKSGLEIEERVSGKSGLEIEERGLGKSGIGKEERGFGKPGIEIEERDLGKSGVGKEERGLGKPGVEAEERGLGKPGVEAEERGSGKSGLEIVERASGKPGISETAIEFVRMEDLDEPEETEEAREMRWLADFIQSEELDWGDDAGTSAASPLEKDWIDEIDERQESAAEVQNPQERQKTAEEEAAQEEAAYEELLGKAASGDAKAMFEAAELSHTGRHPTKDQKQVLRWFRESANLGYVPAMLKMMSFYEKGEMVKQNLKLSMSWAKKAAATGEAEGQYALAEVYIYGGAGKQDVEAGLKILDDMAAEGDERALEKAEEIREKVKRAKERFDAGIRQPSTASGNYEMGVYCQTGDGFYTYPKEAVQYFRKAAEKEHVHAQYELALAYHTGEGLKKNEDECVKWLEKAAAKSHKEATELLKEILEKQRVKREKTEFKNHLRQAEKGDAYAQAKVAELYLNGVGVAADVEKGIEWYEKASETDEGYAARQLAKIYSEGKYVPEDSEKAAYWRMIGGVLDEL